MHREIIIDKVRNILKQHVGKQNAISAMNLYCLATGAHEIPAKKNNQTRIIRSVIRELQTKFQLPVMSGNGYYIADSDAELKVFVEMKITTASRMFGLANKLSGIPIDRMVEQLKIKLENEEVNNEQEN